MAYENTANNLDSTLMKSKSTVALPEERKTYAVENTVLDEFKAQLAQLENAQARLNFMIVEVQSLVRK